MGYGAWRLQGAIPSAWVWKPSFSRRNCAQPSRASAVRARVLLPLWHDYPWMLLLAGRHGQRTVKVADMPNAEEAAARC